MLCPSQALRLQGNHVNFLPRNSLTHTTLKAALGRDCGVQIQPAVPSPGSPTSSDPPNRGGKEPLTLGVAEPQANCEPTALSLIHPTMHPTLGYQPRTCRRARVHNRGSLRRRPSHPWGRSQFLEPAPHPAPHLLTPYHLLTRPLSAPTQRFAKHSLFTSQREQRGRTRGGGRLRNKFFVEFSCEAVWTWAFVGWKIFGYSFHFRAKSLQSCPTL